MDIHIIRERLTHSGVARNMRENSELDLRVVGVNEDTALASFEKASELSAALGTHGDVLQIRLCGADTPCTGLGLVEGRVYTSVGRDLVNQRVTVGGFELSYGAVLKYL